jgi:hypothetical protein
MCFLNQKGRVEAVETKRYPARQRADRLFSHPEAVQTRQQPDRVGAQAQAGVPKL